MAESKYWVDAYPEKKRSAANAIRMIESGQRVFIGSACGEPQELVRALAEDAQMFSGLEIVRMLSKESAPLTSIFNQNNFEVCIISLNIKKVLKLFYLCILYLFSIRFNH